MLREQFGRVARKSPSSNSHSPVPNQTRRARSCGLRRSSFSSAYSIRPAWRQRVASYRLRRSSAKLGRLASPRKQRANSTVVASAFIPVGKRFYVADSQARSCIAAGGFGPPERRVNYLTGIRKQLAVLPIVLSLNLEQSGFHGRG